MRRSSAVLVLARAAPIAQPSADAGQKAGQTVLAPDLAVTTLDSKQVITVQNWFEELKRLVRPS